MNCKRHLKNEISRTFGLVGLALSLFACGDSDDAPGLPDNAAEAVETYAEIAHESYRDSLTEAKKLHEAVEAFVDDPTDATLMEAREAWLAAREPYLQTEVYRFYDGPIEEVEGMVNAWPLDEAYVDYVEGDEDAGLVNDDKIKISSNALSELNEQGGEENIATGFHAIEFLLWGQDQNEDGPGDRPFTDYVTSGDDAAPNAERRAEYLTTVSDLLVDHLEEVTDDWAGGEKNYRATFVAAAPSESLQKILTGMIVLAGFETGGERLQTALDSGDQEDEHSCFSDNTHRDMIQDIQGIKNVWDGTYERLSGKKVRGTGVRDVVAVAHSDLAQEIDAQVKKSLKLANALEPPFDQEIQPKNEAGRERLTALVGGLRDLERLFEDVFHVLGFTLAPVE